MRRRQTIPRRYLIIRGAGDREGIAAARLLPPGSGVLVLSPLSPRELHKLQRHGLTLVREGRRSAARVHNVRELRSALLARTPLILLSPLYPTATHPGRAPIPHMRAAALARLARRRLFALGGMDARKFARITSLGFKGWAGISAFRT